MEPGMKHLGKEIRKVYVISPYTDEDAEVREHRYNCAVRATGELINKGYIAFSPIVHCHPIMVDFDLPPDYDYWAEYVNTFVEWCDAGYVLCLRRWLYSKGIAAEVAAITKANKPIFYSK